MSASMGTAVHNSVEDLCNLDIEDRGPDEIEWLPPIAKEILDSHWEIEKEIFMETPRHPRWKDDMITKAYDGLVGALRILFSKSGIERFALSDVTIEMWKQVQSIVLALSLIHI